MSRKKVRNLILLDIGLPVGDGFIVMERLLSIASAATPINMLTGRDPSTTRE